jgi:hypothetical protein
MRVNFSIFFICRRVSFIANAYCLCSLEVQTTYKLRDSLWGVMKLVVCSFSYYSTSELANYKIKQ